MQNKCIRFCFQLDKMPTISHKEFKDLNWLPVITRFEQCVIYNIILTYNIYIYIYKHIYIYRLLVIVFSLRLKFLIIAFNILCLLVHKFIALSCKWSLYNLHNINLYKNFY